MTGKKKVNDFHQINRLMGKPNGSVFTKTQLVNITNGKEVLRVSREKAKNFFFKRIKAEEKTLKAMRALKYEVDFVAGIYYEPIGKWKYTTKKVYKQYIESKIPGSKIPAPEFHYNKTVTNGSGKKESKTFLKNIYQ